MDFKEKVLVCRNFLSVEDHTLVVDKTLKSNNWSFGRGSNRLDYEVKFWGINLYEDKFFSEYLLQKVKKTFDKNLSLKNVHANGQTYGQCGYFHRDFAEENLYTLVYFTNPVWDVNWGGNLVLFDDKTQSIYNEPFEPNKAVLFPSNILHYGSEPSRLCSELRVTIAFVVEDLNAT